MSDDTTTWLKKNPAVNPLRKSLKTSLRFHVPSSEMNTSIMSNPDKMKDQGLFIPRMLQRSNLQMRKSRASEFKVPEMVTKPVAKFNDKLISQKSSGSGVRQKKIPTPNRSRKSLLPVSKGRNEIGEKKPLQSVLPRASFFPKGPVRRTSAERDLIKKAVELSELKRKEETESRGKGACPEESSVLRSILKRRTSQRRRSTSEKKPKAKKVLFDRFELTSDGEKENEVEEGESLVEKEEGEGLVAVLDGAAALVDFPGNDVGSPDGDRVDTVFELWQTYKDNLSRMQTERTSLEDSFESLLQHSLSVREEYRAYRESAEEMYETLTRLGREIEEGLRKAAEGRGVEGKERERERERERKGGRIKMSEKSKTIKRNSARKCVPVVSKDVLRDIEDSFCFISRTNI